MTSIIFSSLLAYGIGCCVTGYYLALLRYGVDIRTLGSGSCGARNVHRLFGLAPSLVVAVGDILRGVVAVKFAVLLGTPTTYLGFVALAVSLGHVWPIQLQRNGGRGILVSLGALAVVSPHYLLVLGASFIVLWVLVRKPFRAGVLSFPFAPVLMLLYDSNLLLCISLFLIGGLIVFTHWQYLATSHHKEFGP